MMKKKEARRKKKEERRKKKEERRKKKEKKKQKKKPGGLGPEDNSDSLAAEGNALEHAPQRHQPQGTSRLKHP